MIDRFKGEDGSRRLVQLIQSQTICLTIPEAASELSRQGELVTLVRNEYLIRSGSNDNSLYLILSGSVEVLVKGKVLAVRSAGNHVGEIAAIDPSRARTADVVCKDDCLFLKISESALSEIAKLFPVVWRNIAIELTKRLLQRNELLRSKNENPRVFIASSKESLSVAEGIKNAINDQSIEMVIWTDSVFRPSHYTLEDLEEQILLSDFAIAIGEAEDLTLSRGVTSRTIRDNVIFELGLFMGQLGRHRVFLLFPHGSFPKLPSDLIGLNPVQYESGRSEPYFKAAAEIKSVIRKLGPR